MEIKAMKNGFNTYHPISQFLFFASVISFTMFIMHPIILLISLAAGSLYVVFTGGISGYLNTLRLTLPTSLMIILINPLVSHGGITILSYLPDGNPFTLESVIFGIAAALLMSCTLKWFYAVNGIFTSDRVIYLFGRLSPRTALLISMILRFFSKFKAQLRIVRAAQQTLVREGSKGNMIRRIKNGVKIFSSMLQWAMENSIDTADSMNSRGYGLHKRTSYSVFKIKPSDILFIITVLAFDIYILAAYIYGAAEYSYYPMFDISFFDLYTVGIYTAFLILCFMPFIIDVREAGKWKSIRSGI